MKNYRLYITLFICSCAHQMFAQNLDKIGQKDAVKVSGGINFNTITYAQSGLFAPSREPFTWFASGNINVSILDVALPFTYTYSNQGGKFTQPFNRTAIHPQYKWFKSHIGIVSMSFSPYTMSGQLFLGGGVELTPGKWNIQLMGGRLRKAVDYDPIENNLNSISYKRWGYGLKVGYENKGFGGEVILFKGNDDPSSLNVIPFNSTIKPQDNLVISFKGKAQLTKKVNATAEYAISGLTQNSTEVNDLNPAMQHIFHKILNGNATTDFFNAFNTSINYASDKMNLAFKFEHIDPGYKTLGGYYFNQDLQNFTLAPSFTLFKKKVNIALNTGFQRNNLSTLESSTTNRWIGSANVTFVPGKKLVLTTTYSNFSTFTRNRPTIDPFYYQPADTLNFYQLSQNASAMVSYTLGVGDIKNVLQLVYNYQESTNLSGNISQGGAFGLGLQTSAVGVPTHVHMANLAYTAQFSKINANFTLAANVNQTYILDQNSTFIGPTVNFQKSLFEKKANLGLGTTYNRQYSNADLTSNILNHRVSFGISPKFKNEKIGQVSISANANLMQRFAIATNQVNVHEMNVYVNLSYSF